MKIYGKAIAQVLFLLINAIAINCWADQFYLIAGATCDVKKVELRVWFRGAWNEAGEKLVAGTNGKDSWDPRKLAEYTPLGDEDYIPRFKTASMSCRLGGRSYVVEVTPLKRRDFGSQGNCASRTGASLSVSLESKKILTHAVDACTEAGTVPVETILRPGFVPIYKTVEGSVFYSDM